MLLEAIACLKMVQFVVVLLLMLISFCSRDVHHVVKKNLIEQSAPSSFGLAAPGTSEANQIEDESQKFFGVYYPSAEEGHPMSENEQSNKPRVGSSSAILKSGQKISKFSTRTLEVGN